MLVACRLADPSALHGQPRQPAIRSAGAKLFFLPKYSPDLNPIEQVFAKLKHLLRKAAARTLEAVVAAIRELLDAYTAPECATAKGHRRCFGSSGALAALRGPGESYSDGITEENAAVQYLFAEFARCRATIGRRAGPWGTVWGIAASPCKLLKSFCRWCQERTRTRSIII
jgi:DDE superfamily endonuclease